MLVLRRRTQSALVPVHRAVSAVQHGVLRSKHWFAPATAVAAYALLGLTGWLCLVSPDKYVW